MTNKLKQLKINLIKEKDNIINLTMENRKINKENQLLKNNFITTIKNIKKIKKYKNKIKKLRLECLAYSFFCLTLAALLGPLCVTILGMTNLYLCLIVSSLFFMTMFPTFMFMFVNQFEECKKVSRFLKENKLEYEKKYLEKLKNKEMLNKEKYISNINSINKSKLNIKNISNVYTNMIIENTNFHVNTQQFNNENSIQTRGKREHIKSLKRVS